MDEAVVGVRGYDRTGEDRLLESYHRSLPAIDAELGTIRKLTVDNLSQQKRLTDLETLVAERLNSDQGVSRREERRGGMMPSPGCIWANPEKYCGNGFGEAVTEMEAEERRLTGLACPGGHVESAVVVRLLPGRDGREPRDHGLGLAEHRP